MKMDSISYSSEEIVYMRRIWIKMYANFDKYLYGALPFYFFTLLHNEWIRICFRDRVRTRARAHTRVLDFPYLGFCQPTR